MALAKKYYTPEEYLALEREAEYKSEYIDGQIYPMGEVYQEGNKVYAMSGASEEHNSIALNIAGELRTMFKGRTCKVYINDMRVKVRSSGMYTYPDVVAVCDKPQFEDKQVDTLLNPTVIVEVLSPSTELYDRGGKFANYRRLGSLMEYVLVAQDKVLVEQYTRLGDDGDEWVLKEINNLDSTLRLSSIGCEIALAEIYDKVQFASDGSNAAPE